jgi:hypothetical protein
MPLLPTQTSRSWCSTSSSPSLPIPKPLGTRRSGTPQLYGHCRKGFQPVFPGSGEIPAGDGFFVATGVSPWITRPYHDQSPRRRAAPNISPELQGPGTNFFWCNEMRSVHGPRACARGYVVSSPAGIQEGIHLTMVASLFWGDFFLIYEAREMGSESNQIGVGGSLCLVRPLIHFTRWALCTRETSAGHLW